MNPTRRKILATGAAATAMAAVRRVFAEEIGQGGTATSFYEKGPVRIHYEETGSGFPMLLIPGGGHNSVMSALPTMPFNPIAEFKGEYRCIAADLRNAIGGQTTGPLEADRGTVVAAVDAPDFAPAYASGPAQVVARLDEDFDRLQAAGSLAHFVRLR